MIIIFLLGVVRTQILDCIIFSGDCPDNYNPVCGLNITESPLQTFPNECDACKASSVVKYYSGDCRNDNKNTNLTMIDIGSTSASPLPGNYTYLISCSDPRPSVCGTNAKQTCGFFDSTVSCQGTNCQQQFLNECQACSNSSIHSYFFGNCSDYIPQQPTVISCNSDASKKCDIKEKVDVCGFLDATAICQNPPCLQPFDNLCEACQQSNITSYFVGKCNQYHQLFQVVASQETDYFIVENYEYCSAIRPNECRTDFQQTCGVLKQCQGNNCERIYDSPCNACLNNEIEGYYIGECLYNAAYLLSIVILFIII